MKLAKLIVLRLALICFGGIVGLLLLESGLRLYGISERGDRLSVYEFDSTLGWSTRANSKYFRSTKDFAHFNYYNPAGFPVAKQDWEIVPNVSDQTIAFIGDSFTEGYYFPYEQTYTHLVDMQFPDKQVINLGVAAYAPDQYLLAARKHIGAFNVTDIVVTFFPHNDLLEMSKSTNLGYAKPIFGDSVSGPTNLPLKKLDGGKDTGTLRWFNDHSALIRAINPWLFRYIPGIRALDAIESIPVRFEEAAMFKALKLIKQIEVEFPVNRFFVYYIPLRQELEDDQIFIHNIEQFDRLCGRLNMSCFSVANVAAKAVAPRRCTYQQTDISPNLARAWLHGTSSRFSRKETSDRAGPLGVTLLFNGGHLQTSTHRQPVRLNLAVGISVAAATEIPTARASPMLVAAATKLLGIRKTVLPRRLNRITSFSSL